VAVWQCGCVALLLSALSYPTIVLNSLFLGFLHNTCYFSNAMLNLPNELLRDISEYLESERDINAVVQSNRRLYRLLDSYLYRHNVQQPGSSALLWAARHGQEATAQKSLREKAMSATVICRSPLSVLPQVSIPSSFPRTSTF
jgi:hypothetical protein